MTEGKDRDIALEREPAAGEAGRAEQGMPPALGLAEERNRLAAEKAELQDLLQRRQAEFENFRRRAERERAEIFEAATMETVRALLPMVDDMERALRGLPAGEGAVAEYARGVELIYQRLSEALRKLGLEPVETVGKPFDPNLHHAIQKADAEGAEEGTVLEEFQRGYFFKGKLLRAAMVKVASKS